MLPPTTLQSECSKKNKLLVISFLMVLMFTGCGKKDAEPVVSEVVEEIEEEEPVEEVETAEPTEVSNGEYNGAGEDVEVEGEIVEGTALTQQEEIEELKANAPSDAAKRGIEAYEAISAGGTYTSSSTGVVFDKVVGTPNEDGWCKFDDAKKTIYYDYDAWYADATANPIPKNDVKVEGLDESEWDYWM